MLLEIGFDIVRRPIDQRVDFQPSLRIGSIDFEAGQIGAGRRLESLATSERRIEISKSFGKRPYLANFAAAVRVI